MKVHLTKHGKERLYERVYKKSQHKTLPYAQSCIEKVLERGVITVKTCHEHRLGVYLRGEKRTVSSKKNFLLCA